MNKVAMYKEKIYKEAASYTMHTSGNKDKNQTIYYRKPSLLGRLGKPEYMVTSKASDVVLDRKDIQALKKDIGKIKPSSSDQIDKLMNKYKNKAIKSSEYILMEPKPVIFGKKRWKNLSKDPLCSTYIQPNNEYNSLSKEIAKLEATNFGKMKANYKEWENHNKKKQH